MTDQELNDMLDVIAEHDLLCNVCYYCIDCHGMVNSPNGPIFPPCSDWGAGFDSGLFSEEEIIDVYNDIIEGEN